ncbi:hypothetical protein FGB62_164g09 [Gracilaria domingensis]|nr:hypothetical protein FGB62_164g09 [Gracilaria domingensis]
MAGGSILVTSSADNEANLSSLAAHAKDAFVAVDHSDYQQVGIDMVKFILSAVVSSSSTDFDALANPTAVLNQIAANSAPSAIQSAGGAQRTPDTEALQQLQDLLDSYDLTPNLIMASYSEGPSRTRLPQSVELSEEEIIGIWLDVCEVMKEQLVLAVLRKFPCGCEEEVRTGISAKGRGALRARQQAMSQENSSLSTAAAHVNPTQGGLSEVRMQLLHFCNSKHGLGLALDVRMEQPPVEFSWCKWLHENSIKGLYFAVMKSPDYGGGCNQQEHYGGRVAGHQGLLWAASFDCARSRGRREVNGRRSGAVEGAAATQRNVGRKSFSEAVRAGVNQHQHSDRAGKRSGVVVGGAVDAVRHGGGDGSGDAVVSADAVECGRAGGGDGGGVAGARGGRCAGGRGRNVRGARRLRARYDVPGGPNSGSGCAGGGRGGGDGWSERGGARVSTDVTDRYNANLAERRGAARAAHAAAPERVAAGRDRAEGVVDGLARAARLALWLPLAGVPLWATAAATALLLPARARGVGGAASDSGSDGTVGAAVHGGLRFAVRGETGSIGSLEDDRLARRVAAHRHRFVQQRLSS